MRILERYQYIAWWVALLAAGCAPDLDVPTWRIDSPRVLAVVAEPAEPKPGQTAQLTALVASPTGTQAQPPLHWRACGVRPALSELAPVAAACLSESPTALTELGQGPVSKLAVSQKSCSAFGPIAPVAETGQPAGRPADADATGGYYAPVRVDGPQVDSDATMVRVRLACGLAGATQQVAAEFAQRYRLNTAPVLDTLRVRRGGTSQDLAGAAAWAMTVKPSELLQLTASWADCGAPTSCGDGRCDIDETALPANQAATLQPCPADCAKPKGCTGAERYLVLDPLTHQLHAAREAVRVAWYATAGALADACTGRTPEDQTPSTGTSWVAPAVPGPVWLWLVVRDDRGGVSWREVAVTVQP